MIRSACGIILFSAAALILGAIIRDLYAMGAAGLLLIVGAYILHIAVIFEKKNGERQDGDHTY